MPESAASPRALAMQLLLRSERDHVYANLTLDTTLRRYALSAADRALLTVLVFGVIEKQTTLDYLLAALSSRPVAALDDNVRVLLRLGLYQLRYLTRVPPHAALYETVALAPARQRGFVNAVLREYTRRGGDIPLPDRECDPVAYLSVAFSVPEPLCARFVGIFGAERTASLLAAFDRETTAGLTVRVNTARVTPEELAAKWRAAGLTVRAGNYSAVALTTDEGNPRALPGFDEGLFFVQDEASQLCVEALGATAGQTVMDVCACPGSKTFGIALGMQDRGGDRGEYLGGNRGENREGDRGENCGEARGETRGQVRGRILASDLHENKLSLITAGAGRLGLDCIEVAARDARTFCPQYAESADAVLCDVPCSGYGVIAKKPEIRHKPPETAAGLPDIQLAIADTAARYLKKGGVMVYSTCTLLPEENERNVARLLAAHPELSPCDFTLGGGLASTGGALTLTPDVHGTDGFFIAKLKKE